MFEIFGIEKAYFEKFIDFQNNLEQLKSMSTIEIIEKVKAETYSKIASDRKNTYKTIENEAHINIKGQLREQPEICASLFGGQQTLYSDITNGIIDANNDPDIDKIILNIDSPGGTVSGVDIAAMVIKNSKKPIESRIQNMAASAAYWLAAQTYPIVAMTPTVEVGSIGIVAEVIDRSKQDEKHGIKRYSLTSTDAPEKRPDISKKTGRDIIIGRINDLHDVFVSRISEGRKIDIKTINNDFGKGGVLIAEKALKAGMIDEIQNNSKVDIPINKNNIKIEKKVILDDNENKITKNPPLVEGENIFTEVNSMNLTEFKSTHPDLYNQVQEEGIQSERKRVVALENWDMTPEARKVSKQAIIEGKDQNEVLAQLTAASASSEKIKKTNTENVPDINNASSANDDIAGKESVTPSVEEINAEIGGI